MAVEMPNWDDMRVFLSIFRTSSARRAAQDLGVSRPTVTRRLAALEESLGIELFDRRSDGLHPTEAAIALLPAAEEAERSMLGVLRSAHAADHQMRGPIHVTVPAIVAAELLMPDMVAFCERWPEIHLHMSGSYQVSDLAQREADVAIRFMPLGKSPEETLTGRKVLTAYSAAYGHGDQWIGTQGPDADRAWIENTDFPDLPSRGAIWDGSMLISACRHGLGMAYMPCFMGDGRLERRSEPEPSLDVWVLVHPDLKRNPRLRAFRDAMVEGIKRCRPQLEGRVPGD